MFCPKCGGEDQEIETYCRQCGGYLPDFENTARRERTPAEQFKMSLVFNLLSAVAGVSMAIALFVVHAGQDDTHPVIFAAISLFLVISTWQTVSFFNNLKLRRRFVREEGKEPDAAGRQEFVARETKELLAEADMSDFVPASVTENSTRDLGEKIKVSTDTHKESD